MEQRRTQPRNKHTADPAAGRAGQAGFSLIEVMVVIAVMGALTAAVSVNWASFIRHQELRQDAINLHKEIMALKARAIEQDTVAMITIVKANPRSYTIKWFVRRDAEDGGTDPTSKVITLNGGVVISTKDSCRTGTGLPAVAASNEWEGGGSDPISIIAEPKNLEAYHNGWIVVMNENGKAKARYCIQKDGAGIRPEIYYQSNRGGAWTRM